MHVVLLAVTDVPVAPLVALGLVVYTLTNLAKYLRAKDWNGVLTLGLAWVIGVLAIWLFGATSMAHGITINGTTLDKLALGDKIVYGLVLVSVGSPIADYIKARDNTQTAAKPLLTTGQVPEPIVPAPVAPVLPPIAK